MKKVELLSPVGNFAMLKQAIHNGTDAVYLGGKNFGARKYSDNFTKEELKEVIRYAHLYDVKVYLTVNTIVYEKEINDFIEYIKYLYSINVDALIMQDIGMICLVKSILPDFEIHASTQMNIHNQEGFDLLEDIGISRIVLAREMGINEIKNIKTKLEKEVFIHGALCISYSGNCLFSSLIGNRSGNRGECAGTCRLPYKLLENDKIIKTSGNYLLSTKELSSIDNLKNILDANVDSLKIEGRMKSPEYVGLVTKIYRSLIDKYYMGKELTFNKQEIDDLKQIFNRQFTKGFINNATYDDLMNIKTPNHLGINIGEVVDFNKKKIKIKLNKELNQYDGIRFKDQDKGLIVNYLYDKNDNYISSSKDYVYLDNNLGINTKTQVLRTFSYKLKKKLEKINEKKINIKFNVKARLNEQLQVSISDNNNTFTVYGNIVEKSLNRATTKEEIENKLLRIKDTPFICNEINIDIDNNTFIPISSINNIRRDLIDKLLNSRYRDERELSNKVISLKNSNKKITNEISIIVRNEEQLKTCLSLEIDNIYVDDYTLFLKYKNHKNVYYNLDRVNIKYRDYLNDKLLINDLASINKYDCIKNSSCYLNIVNSYSVNYLLNYVDKVTLSVENSIDSIKDIIEGYKTNFKKNPNLDIVIYGKVDLMIMKYCPLNLLVNKDKTCRICKNGQKYYLQDRKNELYRILQKNEITHLIHSKNINYLSDIDKLKKIGISNFTIILLDEDEKEIKKIIKYFK